MALTVAEKVSETGPASNNFVSRTLSFVVAPVPIGTRAVVTVDLYTSTGTAATAGMISDPGGHTWTQLAGQTGDSSTGGVAILSTVAVSAITDITLTPGGSGNYATWAIERLSGPADVDDAEVGSGNSTAPAAASMTATTTDGVAIGVISTRGQSGNQTPPSGWTAIELQPDNSTDLAGAIAHSPNIASTGAVTSIWTKTETGEWFAASVLFKATSADPEIFHDGERTGDVATSTLTLPFTPLEDGRIVVGVTLWSTSDNAGKNPTASMVSDTMGNASGDYAELAALDKAVTPPVDVNTPGLAMYVSPPLTSGGISGASGTYEVTFDMDPGGSDTGFFTWWICFVPDLDGDNLIADTSSQADGPLPAAINFGTCAPNRDRYIVFVLSHNRGHESESDIDPPAPGTWTVMVHNEENSTFLSGHGYYLEDTDTDAVTPTMAVTNNTGPGSVTYTRGLMVILNREGGDPVVGATIYTFGLMGVGR